MAVRNMADQKAKKHSALLTKIMKCISVTRIGVTLYRGIYLKTLYPKSVMTQTIEKPL